MNVYALETEVTVQSHPIHSSAHSHARDKQIVSQNQEGVRIHSVVNLAHF